jgi:hypothetical protein
LPVTLAMDVAIDDKGTSRSARLFRLFSNEQQRFVWRGSVPDPIADDRYIAQLAQAAGAELSLEESVWRFSVREVDESDLPAGIDGAAKSEIDGLLSKELAETFDTAGSAEFREITRAGEVVGFIAGFNLRKGTSAPVRVAFYYHRDGELIATAPAVATLND